MTPLLLQAGRETIEQPCAEGRIGQDIARHLERELDLEEESALG